MRYLQHIQWPFDPTLREPYRQRSNLRGLAMPMVRATDRQGREHELTVADGGLLMEELRSLEDGVFALCGGCCVCATCHVYVDADWSSRLPTPLPQESEMLVELPARQHNSRLSCQLVLGSEHSGLKVIIAPEAD